MPNNDRIIKKYRVRMVDPNNFDYQYNGGSMFGGVNYNMSVPSEELSIIVELVTNSKSRSVLINGQNVKSKKNIDGSGFVSFIKGANDGTTGFKNYLTTNYTDIATQKIVEESLGITDINIEFNSSYAPMVNINFVDVRGGAIFQSGAESIYNVLFRLPYPLFELKVKGFYGKPVTYCLHLIKCTTKFNSLTGNFEISANFVGYTYAMLSDMIVGYLRAAARLPEGAKELANKGTISINDFMFKMSQINDKIKDLLNDTSNESRNNYRLIGELENDLTTIEGLLNQFIANIKDPNVAHPLAGEVPVGYSENIVFVADPNTNPNIFEDTKNTKFYNEFYSTYTARTEAFNVKAGNLESLKIDPKFIVSRGIYLNSWLVGSNSGPTNQNLIAKVKQEYAGNIDTSSEDEVKGVIDILQKATPTTLSSDNANVRIYDATYLRKHFQNIKTEIEVQKTALGKLLAEDLAVLVTGELDFQPNIRNIFKMFTAHIEVFLQLLYNVSSQYTTKARLDEFTIFNTSDPKSKQRIDVKLDDIKANTIYPWPEYIENDEEKYLGKPGLLANPLNVPEIKFVEDIYAAMVENIREDEKLKENANGVVVWQSFTPSDSYKLLQTSPYDRLPDSATHNDVARLILLRAVGFLAYSNTYLNIESEIKLFADSELQLILKKYKESATNILSLLQTGYDTVEKFTQIKGTVENIEKQILENYKIDGVDFWKYNYISKKFNRSNTSSFELYFLPINEGFNNITNTFGTPDFASIKLSNRTSEEVYASSAEPLDTSKYIEFIEKENYEKDATQSNVASGPSVFDIKNLSNKITADTQANSAGFKAGNGRYGVQEFTQINYASGIEVITGAGSNKKEYSYGIDATDFFSVFYDNPVIWDGWDPPLTGLAVPRQTGTNTNYDLTNNNGTFRLFSYASTGNNIIEAQGLTAVHKDAGKSITLFNNKNTQDQVSFPYFCFGVMDRAPIGTSLFGSLLYNAQESDTYEARTFLFLHTFPWRGLMGRTSAEDGGVGVSKYSGVFNQEEILNIFKLRNGFIQVPKLWPAFIGGLIWRYREGAAGRDPIKFFYGTNNDQPVIPGYDADNFPSYDKYLKVVPTAGRFAVNLLQNPISTTIGGIATAFGAEWSNSALNYVQLNHAMCFCNYSTVEYVDIESEILSLPPKVQDKFVEEFKNFVKEYKETHSKYLELLPINAAGSTNAEKWISAYDTLFASTSNPSGEIYTNTLANLKTVYNSAINKSSLENDYIVLTYFTSSLGDGTALYPNQLFIEYKQNGEAEKKLKELFFSYKYIANDSRLMFAYPGGVTDFIQSNTSANPFVFLSKEKLSAYLSTIIDGIKNYVAEEQKVKFNSLENEQIKLEIYRTLKKIYDKWIGGVDGGPRAFSDILFQCCERGTKKPLRLPTDAEMNKQLGGNGDLNFIDSFRFVSRSFQDIGDKFQINPVMVTNQLFESSNVSIYDLFSRILTENNFDFIALPNFINFNDDKELSAVFEPIPYYLADKIAATGPSFVCVYVGQTSTKLDFGNNSVYPNDGFDLDEKGLNWPDDFKEEKQDWEDFASAFVVNYGHQNQNIFKDVRLDQNEFNETAESLQITDAISNTFSKASQTYVGQNLYNVYSVRSYKVEIEMMGDAMIQPMMYFQLNNIPMFHGAYLITKVSHSIKPNNMTTVFTGTRIRIAKTPLIDIATLYSALLAGNEVGPAGGSTSINITSTQNFGNIPLPAVTIGNISVNVVQNPVQLKGSGKYKDGNPEYIVLHWSASKTFANPTWKGYHFEIDTDGTIKQTCDLEQIASHAGCFTKNKSGGLEEKSSRCAQLNGKSIGISYVGGVEVNGDNSYVRTWDDWQQTNLSLGYGTYNAKAQWEGIIGAILVAKQKYPQINAITSHHLTSSDKSDVGDNFPWDRLFDEIEKRTTAVGTPWRPRFADVWFDDSGSVNRNQLVREFSPNNVNGLAQDDLLTTLLPPQIIENNQPRTPSAGSGLQLSYIYEYLNSRLNNKNLAVGIMANMARESGYNPKSAGDKRSDSRALKNTDGQTYCSWGLTQVNVCGGAGEGYLKFYGKENATEQEKIDIMCNAEKHMDYVIAKVKELFPNTWQQLRTPEQWAEDVAIEYERCADCKTPTSTSVIKRKAEARALATQSFYTGINTLGTGNEDSDNNEASDTGSSGNYPPTTATATANFAMSQFNSKDGAVVPTELTGNVYKLMEQLEVIRTELGNAPIRINSGYRSPAHNARTKGAVSNSQHTKGKAADIHVTGYTPKQVKAAIEKLINQNKIIAGGVGLYNTFVHYDIRGYNTRWNG